MKNSKRMMAVIAASGLALAALPGVANAQGSEDLLDLNLNLGLGDSVGLGVNLGLGSLGIDPSLPEFGTEFPALTGSLTALDDAGSAELASGSDNLDAVIGDVVEAGSAEGAGSGEGSNNEGSNNETPGAGSDNGSDDGENESGDTGSLGSLTGSLEPDTEGDEEAPTFLGSLQEAFGSEDEGNENGADTGSAGGSSAGSDETTPDEGEDEGENGTDTGSLESDELLMLGSLAGAGIAVGLAVSGGVNLPPLPEVNLGFVCQLPQPAIDFLKSNGSMQPEECLPQEQN